MTAPEADLTGWACEPFSAAGFTLRRVPQGCRSRVVLIPEMPGAHPGVLALGDYLVDNGFTVAIPSLYGTQARPPFGPRWCRFCCGVRRQEFAAFATNKDRPVSALPAGAGPDLKEKTGSKGVGVIGQCFSGGFALAAAVDDSVLAPVLSQPSVPLPLTAAQRRDPGIRKREMKVIEQRAADEGLCALGLRFSGDPLVPAERFRPSGPPGDAFEVIEIDSSPGNARRLRPDGALGADLGGPRTGGPAGLMRPAGAS